MLSPSPLATTTSWPIPGDAPNLLSIVLEQADTISAQMVLLDAYQNALNAAQNPPPGTAATAVGTSSNTNQLTTTGVTGSIVTGATIAGSGVPLNTKVLGQISGTNGGAGVYLTSAPTNVPGPVATANGTSSGTNQLTLAAVVNTVTVGAAITGTGVPAGTTISAQVSGTIGGNGVYTTNQNTTLSNVPLTITPAPVTLSFTPPPPPTTWPTPQDVNSLMIVEQEQTTMLRLQSSLLQVYQNLLTQSGVPAPPTGP